MSTVSTEKMMAQIACKAIDDKKGQDIKVIDIHNVSVIADYFVIASGTNSNQVQAIVDNVEEQLGRAGFEAKQIEGNRNSSWILMDYGDVIVHVTVKADPMFERDGYDVTIHVPITFSQAVLGDDVEVPTVDGRIVQHIPEGTQSGTKFRLRGQGIQYLNGRGRGDQYVIVDVEIPKKLNRTQREALKAFEDSLKDDNYEKRKGFFKNLKDRFTS